MGKILSQEEIDDLLKSFTDRKEEEEVLLLPPPSPLLQDQNKKLAGWFLERGEGEDEVSLSEPESELDESSIPNMPEVQVVEDSLPVQEVCKAEERGFRSGFQNGAKAQKGIDDSNKPPVPPVHKGDDEGGGGDGEGLPTPPKWTDAVVLFGGIACVVLVGLLIWLPFKGMNWWQWVLWACGIVFLLGGPRIVGEKERLVISVLGSFWMVYRTGLRWVIPIIMQVRSRVIIKEQPISLFPGKPNIDFKGGGRVQLVDPTIWIKIVGEENQAEIDYSAYKTVYNVVGWGVRVREEAESALGNYLRTLTVEAVFEVFEELTNGNDHKVGDWWSLVKEKFPGLVETMASWGFEVTALTITDFDWTQEVEDARRNVYESDRQVEIEANLAKAAEYKAIADAQEMAGFHGKMFGILKDQDFSDEGANKVATQYVLYRQGTKTGSILDIRGGGQVDVALAEALKVVERVKEKKGEG